MVLLQGRWGQREDTLGWAMGECGECVGRGSRKGERNPWHLHACITQCQGYGCCMDRKARNRELYLKAPIVYNMEIKAQIIGV